MEWTSRLTAAKCNPDPKMTWNMEHTCNLHYHLRPYNINSIEPGANECHIIANYIHLKCIILLHIIINHFHMNF